MKRYFLVDFENVADAGMNGFPELTGEDTVDIFYTQKNSRISMDFLKSVLERGHAAVLRVRKVVMGNQALDLQLASFLGSLIAGSREDCEYWIISRDKGFACLPTFWEGQSENANVRLAGSIREALTVRTQPQSPPPAAAAQEKAQDKAPEKPQDKAPEPETPAAAVAAAEEEKAKAAPQPNEKSVLNMKVQQTLSKAKCDAQVISQTASLIAKAYGDQRIKSIVYRDLIKRYGQKAGLEVYNLVKPLLK